MRQPRDAVAAKLRRERERRRRGKPIEVGIENKAIVSDGGHQLAIHRGRRHREPH